MRTPRHVSIPPRVMSGLSSSNAPKAVAAPQGSSFSRTTVGNGFLRESPKNMFASWDARPHSKSALKRCMYLPLPAGFKQLIDEAATNIGPSSVLPPPPSRPAPEVVPHRRNPVHDARIFAAPDVRAVASPPPVQGHAPPALVRTGRRENVGLPARAWWEDPLVLGSMLLLAPPVGLAALWSSRRYGSEARIALTVMTGLTMCLATAIVVALMLR